MIVNAGKGGASGGTHMFFARNNNEAADIRVEGLMKEVLKVREETLNGSNLNRSYCNSNLQIYAKGNP